MKKHRTINLKKYKNILLTEYTNGGTMMQSLAEPIEKIRKADLILISTGDANIFHVAKDFPNTKNVMKSIYIKDRELAKLLLQGDKNG